MAGPYAHLILVDRLCQNQAQLDSIPNLTSSMRSALENYTPFCKLGAVSPDCPALVGNTGATGYCNVMHYLRTADFVRYAIPRINSMNFGLGPKSGDCAWVQHMVKSMAPKTGRKAVVLPHGALFRMGKEGEIRQKILASSAHEAKYPEEIHHPPGLAGTGTSQPSSSAPGHQRRTGC
jgi:hypothetical protein